MKRTCFLVAATALILVGGGADEPQDVAASPADTAQTTVPVASVLDITETPTTASADPVTGLPPVTFVDGGSATTAADDTDAGRGQDQETGSSTTVRRNTANADDTRTSSTTSSTSTTSTTITRSSSSSSTSTTSPPRGDAVNADAITDALGDIETPEDLAELFPVTPPVDGEGTAIRATISPIVGLASGDFVTIEAENLPAGQFLATAQCDTLPSEAADLGVLLERCNGFGFGIGEADGTGTFTVRVVDSFGNTDCRVVTCYVGIAVLPGTPNLVAFEEISFA